MQLCVALPQNSLGFIPTDAGIGDGLSVGELWPKTLLAFYQMTLEHYAQESRVWRGDLIDDVFKHLGLLAVVFLAVCVAAVDQDRAFGGGGFFEQYVDIRDIGAGEIWFSAASA